MANGTLRDFLPITTSHVTCAGEKHTGQISAQKYKRNYKLNSSKTKLWRAHSMCCRAVLGLLPVPVAPCSRRRS